MAAIQLPQFRPLGNPVGDGIGDITKMLIDARKLQKEQELARAKLLMEGAHYDDVSRRGNEQLEIQREQNRRVEGRDKIKFDQEQAALRAKAGQGIFGALGEGRFGEAEALAAASQFPDAQGNLKGIGLKRLPGAPEPGAAPQAPEFVGPLEDPEQARIRAMGGEGAIPQDAEAAAQMFQGGEAAASEVQAQQALRDQFAQRQAEHPGQVAAFQQSQANPEFELSFPTGDPVRYSGTERKQAADSARKQQAQRLLATLGPNTPPDVQRTIMQQAGLIESGISNAQAAPITNMDAANQARGFTGEQNDLNRENARGIAMLRKKKTGGGGGGAGLTELIAMREQGLPDSEIAARAAQLGISPKAYLPSLKEVRAGAAKEAKAPTEAQSRLAVFAGTIDDAIKNVGDAAVLTPEILAKYQKNQGQAEWADKTAERGLIPGAAVGVARVFGAVAKSKFDGIPPEAQVVLQQIEAAKEAMARIHSGGAIPTAEDRAFADLWAPKAGDSPQLIAQKLRQMKAEGERYMALSGNAGERVKGISANIPGAQLDRASNKPLAQPKNPLVRGSRLSLARQALNDPEATPEEKARAQQIIDASR